MSFTVGQLKELLRKAYVPLSQYKLLEEDVSALETKVRKLSKKLQTFSAGKSSKVDDDAPKYNGRTKEELAAMIQNTTDLYDAVKVTLLALFDENYILSHSVSGKKTWKVGADAKVKDPYDPTLYDLMVSLVREKFPATKKSANTPKVHALQRSIKRSRRQVQP